MTDFSERSDIKIVTQPSLVIRVSLIRSTHYHIALVFALVRELIFQNYKPRNKSTYTYILVNAAQTFSLGR